MALVREFVGVRKKKVKGVLKYQCTAPTPTKREPRKRYRGPIRSTKNAAAKDYDNKMRVLHPHGLRKVKKPGRIKRGHSKFNSEKIEFNFPEPGSEEIGIQRTKAKPLKILTLSRLTLLARALVPNYDPTTNNVLAHLLNKPNSKGPKDNRVKVLAWVSAQQNRLHESCGPGLPFNVMIWKCESQHGVGVSVITKYKYIRRLQYIGDDDETRKVPKDIYERCSLTNKQMELSLEGRGLHCTLSDAETSIEQRSRLSQMMENATGESVDGKRFGVRTLFLSTAALPLSFLSPSLHISL